MILAAYFVGVNTLSFAMLAEDKASSKGLIPFLGRIPDTHTRSSNLLCGPGPSTWTPVHQIGRILPGCKTGHYVSRWR
ncbi:unnamed protein product [Ectocarpus sp. 4 AP-2014]